MVTPCNFQLVRDELRALRTLKREAKSPFVFVLEKGCTFHLHRALAGRSNPVGCWHFAVALIPTRSRNDPPPCWTGRGWSRVLRYSRNVIAGGCAAERRAGRSLGRGWTARSIPFAHVHKMPGDCGCCGHRRRHEMGAALVALSALEIAVRGRAQRSPGASLSGFMARHIEQPGSRHSKPALRKIHPGPRPRPAP